MHNPTFAFPNGGLYVKGSPTSRRMPVRWRSTLDNYAALVEDVDHEAYMSHFAFTGEMGKYLSDNKGSEAGFTGPCWTKWIVFDIDRADLQEALADTRKLIRFLTERYPDIDGCIPVYFSGNKGFHVYLELPHEPAPTPDFNEISRTLAEGLAERAGVKIDSSVFTKVRLIRLPNTRHAKTGLFKKRFESEELFKLDLPTILDLAKNPAGDGMPTIGDRVAKIADDWQESEIRTRRKAATREVIRQDTQGTELRAPKYFMDFIRHGVDEGERTNALFRCAAWVTEAGAPRSLTVALLTEPGTDVGLPPKEVSRVIECGINQACRQKSGG